MTTSIAALLIQGGLRALALEQSQNFIQAQHEAEQRLFTLLQPLLPEGHIHPPGQAKREFPDLVYTLDDSGPVGFQNFTIAHTLLFGLSLRGHNKADLSAQFHELAVVLQAQPGIEVVNMASGYEEDTHNHVVGGQVAFFQPLGFDTEATQPYAVLTLRGRLKAQDPQYDNCRTQIIDREHVVIYQEVSQSHLDQRRESIEAALHSRQLDDAYTPLILKEGRYLQADGGLLVWMDTWIDSYRLVPRRHA